MGLGSTGTCREVVRILKSLSHVPHTHWHLCPYTWPPLPMAHPKHNSALDGSSHQLPSISCFLWTTQISVSHLSFHFSLCPSWQNSEWFCLCNWFPTPLPTSLKPAQLSAAAGAVCSLILTLFCRGSRSAAWWLSPHPVPRYGF